MKVVIMAGGKGTRIAPIADGIPKSMIKIGEMPILEHEICCLKEQGYTDIIITVGYMREHIIDYFGNGDKESPVTGKKFDVHITYHEENEPLGNAGALFKIKNMLEEDFLLLNADVMFHIDFKRFVDFHKFHGGLATLFTHPNSHPYDSGLIVAAEDGKVMQWLTKEEPRPVYYKNRVNAGLHVISPRLLDKKAVTDKVDLDRHLLKPLAGTGKLYCYDSTEYVKDMGTPKRYGNVQRDYKRGIIKKRNLQYKQKAIFMDRDGTINQYVGFLTDIGDFRLLDRVAEAVKKINESEYLAIVITNQPVIARGELTRRDLREIHNKMEMLLGESGAYIDAIYFCPHHPAQGFEGEIMELKKECNCRKPKPGMLFRAAKEFNVDLSKSWMVGDSKNDIYAGKAAGCKTALIGGGQYGQEIEVGSLWDAVNFVIENSLNYEE